MSNRRQSWTPGQGKSAKGKGTLIVPADGVKRVERRKSVPPPEPEPKQATPVPAAGTGRGLPIGTGPSAPEGGATDPGSPAPDAPKVVRGGPSPFSGYAPTAQELAASADAGAESSNQVAAIVMGMGFVSVAAMLVVSLILCAGLFYWNQAQQNDGIAAADKDKGHIRDTGVAPEIIRRKTGGGGGGPGKPVGDGEEEEPAPAAPTVAPVVITVPEHVFFHSLEINCPDNGMRLRGRFRGRKVTVQDVPIREECIVTFQGSEPAKTVAHGGQRLDCVSFNPTECRDQ